MKPKCVVTVAKSGAIYIPKMTTKYLGILDWAGVAIAVKEKYICMRFYKHSITPKMDELVVKLQRKSDGRQAMRGGCRNFAEAIKDDFGDANLIDLHIKTMFADEESVRISLDRPSRIDEESSPEREEKTETSEEVADKAAQALIARWIRANGCTNTSCIWFTRLNFDGINCPLNSGDDCGRRNGKERISAENWLVSNGYQLEPEANIGTISKSAEKQINNFDLPDNKKTSAPRTRPIPEGLPDWLRGPLSRGEHVRIFIKNGKAGWVLGAHVLSTFKGRRPFVIVSLDGDEGTSESYVIEAVNYFQPRLKPAAECLAVAKELKIGLSLMQIEAISNGGVPPESHGLPDEMFE